jgi:hypothetical protein
MVSPSMSVEGRRARLHAQVRYRHVEAQVHAPVELPPLNGGRAEAPAKPWSRSKSLPARAADTEIRGPGPRSLSQSQSESAEAKAVRYARMRFTGGSRMGALSFNTGPSRPLMVGPSFQLNGAPSGAVPRGIALSG